MNAIAALACSARFVIGRFREASTWGGLGAGLAAAASIVHGDVRIVLACAGAFCGGVAAYKRDPKP